MKIQIKDNAGCSATEHVTEKLRSLNPSAKCLVRHNHPSRPQDKQSKRREIVLSATEISLLGLFLVNEGIVVVDDVVVVRSGSNAVALITINCI